MDEKKEFKKVYSVSCYNESPLFLEDCCSYDVNDWEFSELPEDEFEIDTHEDPECQDNYIHRLDACIYSFISHQDAFAKLENKVDDFMRGFYPERKKIEQTVYIVKSSDGDSDHICDIFWDEDKAKRYLEIRKQLDEYFYTNSYYIESKKVLDDSPLFHEEIKTYYEFSFYDKCIDPLILNVSDIDALTLDDGYIETRKCLGSEEQMEDNFIILAGDLHSTFYSLISHEDALEKAKARLKNWLLDDRE